MDKEKEIDELKLVIADGMSLYCRVMRNIKKPLKRVRFLF